MSTPIDPPIIVPSLLGFFMGNTTFNYNKNNLKMSIYLKQCHQYNEKNIFVITILHVYQLGDSI